MKLFNHLLRISCLIGLIVSVGSSKPLLAGEPNTASVTPKELPAAKETSGQQKWEYAIRRFCRTARQESSDNYFQRMNDYFNKGGTLGWELVSFVQFSPFKEVPNPFVDCFVASFKRPV